MRALILALLFGAAAAFAQGPDEEPALSDFPEPEAEPAAAAPPPVQAPQTVEVPENAGTTLVGDRDSPIGLYLLPWRESSAEGGLEKPARLLQEAMLPIDRDVFRRQNDYFDTLTAHQARQAGKP